MSHEAEAQTKSRRQAFALAAALALTVLTGAAALSGMVHRSAPAQTAALPAVPAQIAPAPVEEGGD